MGAAAPGAGCSTEGGAAATDGLDKGGPVGTGTGPAPAVCLGRASESIVGDASGVPMYASPVAARREASPLRISEAWGGDAVWECFTGAGG